MHERVLEAYRKAGVQPPNDAKFSNADPTELAEQEFWASIVPGTEKSRIDSITRIRVGRNKEYVLYDETLIGENMRGQPKYWNYHLKGKYSLPYFTRDFDPNTGEALPSQFSKISRR